MNNALTTTVSNNAVATYGSDYNPFLAAAEDVGASSGQNFLKFNGKTNTYSYGKDEDELAEGTQLAVNASEFKNGWICWNDGKVVEEVMVRVTEGKPPAKHQLTDHGPYEKKSDGWQEQSSVQLKNVDDGEEYLFKTSSKSGRIALGNLMRDYGKAFQMHPGELAIVELASNKFDAKDDEGRKIKVFAPAFKIIAWADEAELVAGMSTAEGGEDPDDYEPEPTPPPKKATPAAAVGEGRRGKRF